MMSIFSKLFKSDNKKANEIAGFDQIVLSVMHWLCIYQQRESDPLLKSYLHTFMIRSRSYEVYRFIKSCVDKYDGKIFKDNWDGQGQISDRIDQGQFIGVEHEFNDFVLNEIIQIEKASHEAFLHKQNKTT